MSARKEGRDGKEGEKGTAPLRLSPPRRRCRCSRSALRRPGCRHAPRTRNAITSPPRSRTLLSRAGRRRAAATIRRPARGKGERERSSPPAPRSPPGARRPSPPTARRRNGSGRAASRGAEEPARGAALGELRARQT